MNLERRNSAMTRLQEAAIEGDLPSFLQLVSEHPNILDLERCYFNQSTLHVALKLGHLDLAKQILLIKPELAQEIDHSQRSSPLHISSEKGYPEMVKMLLPMSPDMCLACNRQGINPVHVAAIRGHKDVLRALLAATPLAAREPTCHGGHTVLHLCVKHCQLETLIFLIEELDVGDLLNSTDNNGNTVLHLAVSAKQPLTMEYLLKKKGMGKNARNKNGMTAMDICIKSSKDKKHGETWKSLRRAKALCAKDASKKKPQAWLKKQRSSLMVVASLIATMAFQVGVNPPGGTWQDDKNDYNGHKNIAGQSIMADKYPYLYDGLLACNTIGLASSLSVILLLISGLPCHRLFMVILMIGMWIAVVATGLSYRASVSTVTPDGAPMTWITILMWVLISLLFLPLAHITRFIAKLIKKHWRTFIKRCKKPLHCLTSHPTPVSQAKSKPCKAQAHWFDEPV